MFLCLSILCKHRRVRSELVRMCFCKSRGVWSVILEELARQPFGRNRTTDKHPTMETNHKPQPDLPGRRKAAEVNSKQ